MLISIVIPVFNEINTFASVLQQVESVDLSWDKEIVIVDDFSTDGTRDILRLLHDEGNHQIIFHSENHGKGAALKSGFARARGDIVIIQDADLEYNPQEYPRLLQPILDGSADVVYGSRFKANEPDRSLHHWHYLGNTLLTSLSNMLTKLNLTDMETCYKVFKKEVLAEIEIEEKRFGFEPEITAKIAKLKCRICEVSISYSRRSYQEGKKIGWKDGFRALWCILKYNLLPKKR